MNAVPAICNACGCVWFTDAYRIGAVASVIMRGNTASPCPRCGGISRIPDGEYRPLSVSLYNDADLARVLEAIEALREKAEAGASPDEIGEEISRHFPNLEWIKRYLPKTPLELVGYLAVLATALGHCAKQPNDAQHPPIYVQVEVRQALELILGDQKTNRPRSPPEQSGQEDPETDKE